MTAHNSARGQVHPGLFTKKLLSLFLSQPRTSFQIASAIGLTLGADRAVQSLKLRSKDGDVKDIPADVVVIAAGPWTGQVVEDLLGPAAGRGLNVTGSRAHSIVLKTKEPLTAHALFTDMTLADGSAGEPEVYARPDGTTYM
jgi:glycine/D-amino acid oxidase-like deaminating enzyme